IDLGQRGRRPGGVKDVRSDVFAIAGDKAARVLVENHQAGSGGRSDAFMGVVHAGASVQIEVIAVDEDGAVGGVVRPDACAAREVEAPDYVRLWRSRLPQ